MRLSALFLLLFLLPLPAAATSPGEAGYLAVRQCVMQNDAGFCRALLTPESLPYFDRFYSYKLMPCLPTDFTYMNETVANGQTTVRASIPEGGGRTQVLRLVFAGTPAGLKLDLPASFRRGLGEHWADTVQMSEQIYLLMRQNMGDKLTCDQLNGLLKPPGK